MSAQRPPFVRPASLAGRHFSTVIVGAGINGVGVFRDLSLQGIDCLIVDKGDFAAGASSAPSRMIHGGLRYLEHGSFSLVAEATRERNLLLRNAPHLVRPLKTVVPLSNHFGGLLSGLLRFVGISASPGARGLLVVALGLRLYDLLGRRQRTMPGHSIERVPPRDGALFRPDVRWTATFFDAWISHPEWLILELIGDACRDQPNAVAANYCKVTGCEGKTLTLRDALGGRMAYFEALDGRVCIVYPFLDRVLVGSTDIPVDDPDQIATEPAEVDYLLEVLGEVFPNLAFGRCDVVYTYVGVRPLARSDADKPGQISRDHSVVIDPPSPSRDIPVVGLVGGKWTTFRALAEEATDEVLRLLGRGRTASTRQLPIGGGTDMPQGGPATERFIDRIAQDSGLGRVRAQALLRRYGTQALRMAQHFKVAGDVPLQHAPDCSAAEVAWLCTETGVIHLDDLVIRRTLLAIRGLVTDAVLAEMAGIAAQALGWDAEREQQELHNCTTALRERHGVRLAPAVPDSDAAPAFHASLTIHPALSPT